MEFSLNRLQPTDCFLMQLNSYDSHTIHEDFSTECPRVTLPSIRCLGVKTTGQTELISNAGLR